MKEEILDKIISLLPLEIKWDKIFSDEMNFVYDGLKTKAKVLSISVCKNIYQKLEDTTNVNQTSFDNNILYITMLKDKLLTLSLKKEKDKYILKSTYTSPGEQEEIIVTFGNRIVVEYKKHTAKDSEYYTSFKVQVGVFDKEYNRVNIDTTKYEDMIFSNFFNVPIEQARYYIEHFSLHLDYLNRMRVKGRSLIDAEENEEFRPPFKLKDLDYHIWEENNRILSDVGETDLEEYNNTHRLDNIEKKLESIIGSDGIIILSPALYHNFWDYREGFTGDMFYSEGYIIKKSEEGSFTMYSLKIENESIVVNQKPLTEDEVKVFYYQNKANENSLELQKFFNINRGRK